MLQQTRVETVIPYFERFLADFPRVHDLAAAPETEVLRQWAGLGYYSRARNLHRAAREIVERHGGALPREAAALRELPGVGRYTAAAIASICFGEAEAVLDGNVKRVIARLFADRRAINDPANTDHFWSVAQHLLDRGDSGDFNQAMMELGATVCTPQSPRCARCPVRTHCAADRDGIAAALPTVKAKRPPRVERRAAAAVRRASDGAILLVRRGERGLLHGMWQLPDIAVERTEERDSDEQSTVAALREKLRNLLGGAMRVGRRLGVVEHVFTHRHWFVDIYESRAAAGGESPATSEARWLHPSRMSDVPLSTLDRKTLAIALQHRPSDVLKRTKRAEKPASRS